MSQNTNCDPGREKKQVELALSKLNKSVELLDKAVELNTQSLSSVLRICPLGEQTGTIRSEQVPLANVILDINDKIIMFTEKLQDVQQRLEL